jgi:hypothetical protein
MLISKRQWIIAVSITLYLYFLLPATAELFYELYHLTKIDAVYWGYTGFKTAGYYFGIYEHRLLVCLCVAAVILIVPALINKIRRS